MKTKQTLQAKYNKAVHELKAERRYLERLKFVWEHPGHDDFIQHAMYNRQKVDFSKYKWLILRSPIYMVRDKQKFTKAKILSLANHGNFEIHGKGIHVTHNHFCVLPSIIERELRSRKPMDQIIEPNHGNKDKKLYAPLLCFCAGTKEEKKNRSKSTKAK